MARYQHTSHVRMVADAIFEELHAPGTPAPHSGIYKCMGCGWEVASNNHQPLPPQNHAQHDPKEGDIRWRLIVLTN
ncbi:MAG TPA: hypothetical protein VGE21_05870 [Flavobacteriales bacterium]